MKAEIQRNGSTIKIDAIALCEQPNGCLFIQIMGGKNPWARTFVHEGSITKPEPYVFVDFYDSSGEFPMPKPDSTRVTFYPTTDKERKLLNKCVLWNESHRMGLDLYLSQDIDNSNYNLIFDTEK